MDDIKLVIFDMAGTTIKDLGQVPEAFTTALSSCNISLTHNELQAVRGASKREAIRILIKNKFGEDNPEVETIINQAYNAFRTSLQTLYIEEGVHFIPGTLDTFTMLRGKDILIALNTGFDRNITNTILANLEWDKFAVDAVCCGDDVSKGRPAPFLIFHTMETCNITSVHDVMTVGDTVLDLEAGNNAGIRYNVGVLSGAHEEAQLRQAPHTHIIPSVADLPRLWEI